MLGARDRIANSFPQRRHARLAGSCGLWNRPLGPGSLGSGRPWRKKAAVHLRELGVEVGWGQRSGEVT